MVVKFFHIVRQAYGFERGAVHKRSAAQIAHVVQLDGFKGGTILERVTPYIRERIGSGKFRQGSAAERVGANLFKRRGEIHFLQRRTPVERLVGNYSERRGKPDFAQSRAARAHAVAEPFHGIGNNEDRYVLIVLEHVLPYLPDSDTVYHGRYLNRHAAFSQPFRARQDSVGVDRERDPRGNIPGPLRVKRLFRGHLVRKSYFFRKVFIGIPAFKSISFLFR